MIRFMLDTNAVSYAIHRRSPNLVRRLLESPTEMLCVSSVTYGEVRYGLAYRVGTPTLSAVLADFFREVDVLSWTEKTAVVYGNLRAEMRRHGKALQPLDMLIAAHALDAGSILVTSDRAFDHVPGLTVEDWTA